MMSGKFDLIEINKDIWSGVEDKSQLSKVRLATKFLQIVLSYPSLCWRYLTAPDHDMVVVPYMGHFDVMIVAMMARMRRVPVIWDAFISLYDTAVCDRKMISKWNPVAWILRLIDRWAARLADHVVLDTKAHAKRFAELTGIEPSKTSAVLVGCEETYFAPANRTQGQAGRAKRVLFYGQFIPLHGVETVIEAARLARDEVLEWHLIGDGQSAPAIRSMIEADPLPKLNWTEWVAYEELGAQIAAADICLGIFGTSAKAANVIPNKVFQALAAGKSVVTRDGPAIRELVGDGEVDGIALVPPADPEALLAGINRVQISGANALAQKFNTETIRKQWATLIEEQIAKGRS